MAARRLLIILLLVWPAMHALEGQIWPFRKKSSVKQATRDLEKRRDEAGQEPEFNQSRQMGAAPGFERTDFLWSAASAATSYKGAGNVSATTPSRLGLTSDVELSTWMALNYWAPNMFVKIKHYEKKKWLLSSLHGLYSASPGLSYVKSGGEGLLADSLTGVPLILSLKNQLIVSRPFYDVLKCNTNDPWLVLSGSLALDVGIPFSDEEVYLSPQHFITPRSAAYAGKGWLLALQGTADWMVFPALMLRGSARLLHGNYHSSPVVEQQTQMELFAGRHLSGSVGYLLSAGNLGSGTFKIWPFVDVSWYFGRKSERARNLFKRRMF